MGGKEDKDGTGKVCQSQMINLIKLKEVFVKSVKLCRGPIRPGVTTARPGTQMEPGP